MDFRPGDIQLLNNAVILHSREAYDDYDEPERKRHLLRLWLQRARLLERRGHAARRHPEARPTRRCR